MINHFLQINKFVELLSSFLCFSKISLSILIISDAHGRIKGEEPKDKHLN